MLVSLTNTKNTTNVTIPYIRTWLMSAVVYTLESVRYNTLGSVIGSGQATYAVVVERTSINFSRNTAITRPNTATNTVVDTNTV
jgi:hypothetical protein